MKKLLLSIIFIAIIIPLFAQPNATIDSLRMKRTDKMFFTNRHGSVSWLRTSGDTIYIGDISGEYSLGQLANGGGATADSAVWADTAGYALISGTTISDANNNTIGGTVSGFSITNGTGNSLFGYASGATLTGGDNNTYIGTYSATTSTGNDNTVVGAEAGYALTTGNSNVLLGRYAGSNLTTQSDRFIVNNFDRNDLLGDTTKSLLCGVFDDDTLNQRLDVNGLLNANSFSVGNTVILPTQFEATYTDGTNDGYLTAWSEGFQAYNENTTHSANIQNNVDNIELKAEDIGVGSNTYNFNPEGLNIVNTYPNSAGITYTGVNDTDLVSNSLAPVSYVTKAIDSLDLAETVSRTIYVATTGSDVTGDGSVGSPYATVLKALQNIKPITRNVTITISLGGIGNFPMTYAETYELASKKFINSTLSFTGTSYTTIESGFTLAKTASRNFAYTLSKSGLTSTLNQYRNYFMTTGTVWYPIASNAIGTNSFEIEYVHNNLTTPTSIIEWGATITNPSNLESFIDFGFVNNINSNIEFKNLNINSGTATSLSLVEVTPKNFLNCKIICATFIKCGTSYNLLPSLKFTNCVLQQVSTGSDKLFQLQDPYLVFNRCFINGGYSTSGVFFCNDATKIRFLNGNYISGSGNTVAAIFQSAGQIKAELLSYLTIANTKALAYGYRNTELLLYGTTYYEFINTPYLFNGIPLSNTNLIIENYYGTLPAICSTTGYTCSDFSNDIQINVTSIPTQGTAVLVAGTVTINTAAVQTGSQILLSYVTPGGTLGSLYPNTIVAGTSFTVTSTSLTDTSTILWQIIK